MRKGTLITRGAIIEHGGQAETRWSLAVSPEVTVLEVAALMQAFGCYAELGEGDEEVRLLPINFRPCPSAEQLADFYQKGAALQRLRVVQP